MTGGAVFEAEIPSAEARQALSEAIKELDQALLKSANAAHVVGRISMALTGFFLSGARQVRPPEVYESPMLIKPQGTVIVQYAAHLLKNCNQFIHKALDRSLKADLPCNVVISERPVWGGGHAGPDRSYPEGGRGDAQCLGGYAGGERAHPDRPHVGPLPQPA